MTFKQFYQGMVLGFCSGLSLPGLYADDSMPTRLYQASMHEASWAVNESVFECSISQAIPLFGEARFFHRAGEALVFELNSNERLLKSASLTLTSIPPPWNFKSQDKDFGALGLSPDTAVRLNEELARLLMAEMLAGMMPRLSGESVTANFGSVAVTLSPLRFQVAYGRYQHCADELLPVNFSQVQRSTIFWPSGAKSLGADALALLDNIVRYSQADTSIIGFEVDSFTDTAGERRDNLILSEERAFMVTNYLIAQGIDPEAIATRAHGEREEYLIVNPEKSQADRDRNRRVNVVLLRSKAMLSSQ